MKIEEYIGILSSNAVHPHQKRRVLRKLGMERIYIRKDVVIDLYVDDFLIHEHRRSGKSLFTAILSVELTIDENASIINIYVNNEKIVSISNPFAIKRFLEYRNIHQFVLYDFHPMEKCINPVDVSKKQINGNVLEFMGFKKFGEKYYI